MSVLALSTVLGRRVRMGGWEDQKVSTHRKVLQALDEARWSDACDLAAYFLDEAQVCWALYRQWIADLEAFLLDQKVPDAELFALRDRIARLVRLPDGSEFDSQARWDDLAARIARVVTAANLRDAAAAAAEMTAAKEAWRQTHDRDVDRTYAFMSEVAERFGDDAIPVMFERVLAPLFAWRYGKFDIDAHPWDEALETLLYVACEAMRGHLAGPDRTGDMDLEELTDRFVLTFSPCGSGGRIIAGDSVEGTPPRVVEPYSWRVAQEPRDWNHYTPGVCLYCAHCIILMEQMPMDRFGYPVRVIDPPVRGDPKTENRCRWTMFKDPTAVPEEYYTRAGRTRPTEFGSHAHRGLVDLPDPGTVRLPGSG